MADLRNRVLRCLGVQCLLSPGGEHFRGGAFNCGDSETLHRCDYDADWGLTARGFRCCKFPQ